MKRGLVGVLIIVVVAVLGVPGYLYVTHSGNFTPAQATLTLVAGKAAILHANGQQNAVEAGKQAAVGTGDSVQIDGKGMLTFVGAQVELSSATRLDIKQYSVAGNDSQIDLVLKAGQVMQRVEPNTGAQPSY